MCVSHAAKGEGAQDADSVTYSPLLESHHGQPLF